MSYAWKYSVRWGCNLGTHDLLKDLLTDNRDDLVVVLPNIHMVINSLSKHESHGFQFEIVLTCHENCDPIGLIAELIGKFSSSHKFITHVHSLCRLPKDTLRPHVSHAYIVGLSSNRDNHSEVQRDWALKESDDLAIPKAIYAQEDIRDILCQKKGPLANFRSGRNGCTDIDDSKNCKTISFDAYRIRSGVYSKEFNTLARALFQEARTLPSAVVQIKKATNSMFVSTSFLRKPLTFGRGLTCITALHFYQAAVHVKANPAL